VCVVRRPSASLSHEQLIEHCERVLAKFQVPRFVEWVDALPKTPTGKISKYPLSESPFTPTTWDRDTGAFVEQRQEVPA
jgi:crotonobetaine/carnitine-CoA ligase